MAREGTMGVEVIFQCELSVTAGPTQGGFYIWYVFLFNDEVVLCTFFFFFL